MTNSEQQQSKVKVTVKLKVPKEIYDKVIEWSQGQEHENKLEDALRNVCYFHLEGWYKMAMESDIVTPQKSPLILPGDDNDG